MHFQVKNILKNNCNNTPKYASVTFNGIIHVIVVKNTICTKLLKISWDD